MTYLTDIIAKRSEVYAEFTTALLVELKVATTAASSLLDPELTDRLVWKTVSLTDDLLTLGGEVVFQVGEKVDIGDHEIEVTKEMQATLARVIQVGIPVELATEGSHQEIVKYLKDAEANNKTANMTFETQNVSIDTVADLVGEFRSAGLTKAQMQSMIFHAEHTKGKVN